MTLTDLLFLASLLFVLTMCFCIAVSAVLRRWKTAGRLGRILGVFLVCHTVVLVAFGLLLPRRYFAPGDRHCFDDWCVAALSAEVADNPNNAPCTPDQGGRIWIATVEVSSDAKRVRQRARDARAELEDLQGKRYQPCAAVLAGGAGPAKSLSDELGPGESFQVFLPFRLPADATPAGLILHHGEFPGIVMVGEDQSLLHRPALHRLTVKHP